MVKRRKSDSPPAKNYSPLTGGHHHKPQKAEIEFFKGVRPLQSTFPVDLFYPLQSMGSILRINHFNKRSVF